MVLGEVGEEGAFVDLWGSLVSELVFRWIGLPLLCNRLGFVVVSEEVFEVIARVESVRCSPCIELLEMSL